MCADFRVAADEASRVSIDVKRPQWLRLIVGVLVSRDFWYVVDEDSKLTARRDRDVVNLERTAEEVGRKRGQCSE